jgi:hypothetical protein
MLLIMHLLILILITSYQDRVAGIFPVHYELERLREQLQASAQLVGFSYEASRLVNSRLDAA